MMEEADERQELTFGAGLSGEPCLRFSGYMGEFFIKEADFPFYCVNENAEV